MSRIGAVVRQHPDRVRSLDWHEVGVTMGEVLTELTRIHAALGRAKAEDDSHPHPRNCCLNLIATVPDGTWVERAEQTGREIAAQHPLRMLTLHLEPARNVNRMDAWISSEAHELAGGMPIQAELVRLHVVGSAAAQPATLIDPVLVPDVPAYLWWLGTPPFHDESFLQTLDVVEGLMVDSATFERPFLSILELADLAQRARSRLWLGDLQWGRLIEWRGLLAQILAPADRLPFLRGINGLGIDYVGDGRGNRVAAALFCGWLAEALDWKLQRAAGGQGGLVVAYYEAAGHPLEVNFRSVDASDLVEGELAAIRVEAGAQGRTMALALERNHERRSRVHVRLNVGGGESLAEERAMDTLNDTELLVDLVVQRRDAVFLGALRQGAALLRALH